MKFIKQRKPGPGGDSFSACLACLLELDLDQVPNFFDLIDYTPGNNPNDYAPSWWVEVEQWLNARGWGVLPIEIIKEDKNPALVHLMGITIVSGPSPKDPEQMHSVIYKNGRQIHDPAPDNQGILFPKYLDLIYPLNPSAVIFTRPVGHV